MINNLVYDIEKRAECAENLVFCRGIKLLKIKDTIASMLKTIGTNEIFEQYIVHDIASWGSFSFEFPFLGAIFGL